MSIFGRNTTNLTAPVFEGYSCENNGDLLAIQEGFEDQLAIIESIHALDMEELSLKRDLKILTESSAVEARMAEFEAVAEGMVKDVWAKIKTFLEKMWGKIKQFFASVVRFFDGMFKSGKEFATKYEKQLRKLNLSGYEYKMFKYTNLDGDKASTLLEVAEKEIEKKFAVPEPAGSKIEDLDKFIDRIDEERSDFFDSLRGTYATGSGSLDNEEFKEALFAHFRDGATDDNDKEDVKINIGEIINVLKTNKDLKNAEDAIKDCDKIFEKKIKKVGEWEKASDKAVGDKTKSEHVRNVAARMVQVAQKEASLFSEAKTIALDWFRAWKEAVTERNNTYKAVCVNAFRYKKVD